MGQFHRVDRGAGVYRRDHGHHFVFGIFGWHADHCRFAHQGMGHDLAFHLERGNVFAAAADRVLDPVDEVEIAVLVAAKGIAGVKPAVAPGARGGFGVLVVPAVHRPRPIAADHHFTDRAHRHFAVVAIDQPHLHPGAHFAACARLDRIGLGHDRRGNLGHVEDGVDIDAEPFAKRPRIAGQRHHESQPHAVIAVLGPGRALHQERRHHPEQENRGGGGAAHEGPEPVGGEILHQRDRPAAGQHHERNAKATDVENRHVDKEPVISGHEMPTVGPGIGVEMQVRRQHALGRPGRARRVDDRLVVPRLDRAFEGLQVFGHADHLVPWQCAQRDRRGAFAHHHHGVDRGAIDAVQPVDQPGMGHQQPRIGIGQHVFQDRPAIGGVERHEHRAQIVDREKQHERIAPVGQPHRHVIALHHAQPLQADRARDHAVAQLRISPGIAVFEHGIDLIAARFGKIVKQVAQHAGAPVGQLSHGAGAPARPSSSPWSAHPSPLRWPTSCRLRGTTAQSTSADR